MPRTSSCTPRSPSSSAGSRAGGSPAASSSSRRKKSRSRVPPEPSPRAVAYVRESTEEQGQGFSPDAQREAIRTFAAENGLALVGEYCDYHSGWKRADGRPEFQRLMSDVAERRFDCVLVYHTSRFARNQVEARRYKQMLRERLGIRVLSVTQPMGEDPSDPAAFLAESIHEMFDEYYSVSLSFWTRTGLREKARQCRQTRSAIGGLSPAQALALRALRRTHARDARLTAARTALPLFDTPPRRWLRPADHTSRAARGTTRRLDLRLQARRRSARRHPCVYSERRPRVE